MTQVLSLSSSSLPLDSLKEVSVTEEQLEEEEEHSLEFTEADLNLRLRVSRAEDLDRELDL